MQLQFKNIVLGSKSEIEKYTKLWNIENGEFTFTNMFIWGTDGRMQYAEEEGFLFIKLEFPGEKPLCGLLFRKARKNLKNIQKP